MTALLKTARGHLDASLSLMMLAMHESSSWTHVELHGLVGQVEGIRAALGDILLREGVSLESVS